MITREWAFTVSPGRYHCPQCDASEKACAVWDYAGYRHVQCKRASCGAFAKYPLYPGSGSNEIAAPGASPEVLRPYMGDRVPLRQQNREQWLGRYGFVPPGARTVGYTTAWEDTPYILPICDPRGGERGVMEAVYGLHKRRRIWKAKDEPMISWTPGGDFYDGVWVVEDQISALKLWEVASIRAVALLGTGLNAPVVAELQAHANNLTIALDADATAKAFMLARRWGAAFKTCQVQILTRDIKDMRPEDILRMTKNAGHGDFGSLHGKPGSVVICEGSPNRHRPYANRRVLVEGTGRGI